MAAGQNISATRAAVEVLKAAGKPLSSKEIIDGVLARNDVKVTSRSSIQASIFTAEKNDRLFKRVSKGVYKLHPKVDEQIAAKPAKKAESKPAEAPAVDEHDVDLKAAAAAADQESKKSTAKRAAKPDPKPATKRLAKKETAAA